MSSNIPSTKELISADAPYTDNVYYVKSNGTEFNDSNMKKAIKQNDNKYKVNDSVTDLSNYNVYKKLSYFDKIRDNVSNLIHSSSSGGKKSKKQRKSKKSKTTKKRKSRRRG